MEIHGFYHLCRLCLSAYEDNAQDVFKTQCNYLEILKNALNIHLEKHSYTSSIICNRCIAVLTEVQKFHLLAKASEEKWGLYRSIVALALKTGSEMVSKEELVQKLMSPFAVLKDPGADQNSINENPRKDMDIQTKEQPLVETQVLKEMPVSSDNLSQEDNLIEENPEDIFMDDEPFDDIEYFGENPSLEVNTTKESPEENPTIDEDNFQDEIEDNFFEKIDEKFGWFNQYYLRKEMEYVPHKRKKLENPHELIICPICAKMIKRKSMSDHRKKSHYTTFATCPICKKTIPKCFVASHVTKHKKEPVACEICGQILRNKNCAKNHVELVHNKKGAGKCLICNRFYSNIKTHNRDMHQLTRRTMKRCPNCNKEVLQLPAHLRICGKDREKHSCDICGNQYVQLEDMIEHRNFKHLGIRIPCLFCDYSGSDRRTVNKHMQTKHSEEYEEHKETEAVKRNKIRMGIEEDLE